MMFVQSWIFVLEPLESLLVLLEDDWLDLWVDASILGIDSNNLDQQLND